MVIYNDEIEVSTHGNTDIIDITGKVQKIVSESKIKNGQVMVFVVGSTASISTIEYEPGLVKDFKSMCEKIAPVEGSYAHHTKWGDNNGSAHVRAALIGQTQMFPLINGKLPIGTWQQVILIDFDTRPRKREIIVQIIGERS
jgi:secondary thiamine-phosphate synthase enzyme